MKGPGKVVPWLLVAAAVGVAALFSHAFLKTKKDRAADGVLSAPAVDSDIRLTDMDYTEVREGKPIWRIKAHEAKYYEGEQKTLLSRVDLTLFMESDREVHLASDYGLLHTGRKDIELWGRVTARVPQGYEVETDKVYYDHGAQKIRSQAPVRLMGPQVDLQGNQWQYDLATSTVFVEGEVRALVRGLFSVRNGK
uniref:LPS export ABC transporter periplasmic protein LptC n=1 Tax=Desulfacinum infernum TaxID=35837 RepID=A0A832A5N0_9BACT